MASIGQTLTGSRFHETDEVGNNATGITQLDHLFYIVV